MLTEKAIAALNTAADSAKFKQGLEALARGDLVGVERSFFGGNIDRFGGFFGELVAKGLKIAALDFQDQWDKAVEKALKRQEQLEKRLRKYVPSSGG
jgi:hypothetical protein